jgi:hypothetical protein
MDTKAILKDRLKQHGDYKNRADMTIQLQNIIDAYIYAYEHNVPSYQLDALRMICVKIARIANGDHDYDDHWLDIIGYSQLVCEQLHKQQPPSKTTKKDR